MDITSRWIVENCINLCFKVSLKLRDWKNKCTSNWWKCQYLLFQVLCSHYILLKNYSNLDPRIRTVEKYKKKNTLQDVLEAEKLATQHPVGLQNLYPTTCYFYPMYNLCTVYPVLMSLQFLSQRRCLKLKEDLMM